MSKIFHSISLFYNNIKCLVYKFLDKILFLFNKQRTLQKMYEPMVKNRLNINKELNADLRKLQHENRKLMEEIRVLTSDNSQLQAKLSALQDMIIIKNL